MKKNEHVVFCSCGCGNGVVLKAECEDQELVLQLVSDNYYLRQKNEMLSWKGRLKRILCILRGKEYGYFDILIDKNELQEFKEFVAKL